MSLVKWFWSGVRYLLQRGTTRITSFLIIWAVTLIYMLDDIAVVTYEQDWLSGGEIRRIKLDSGEAGLQFGIGAIVFLTLSVSTFFVNFYEEPEANNGVRALFGVVPLSLAALLAYFMLQH